MRIINVLGRSGAAGIATFVALAIASMLVPFSLGSASLGSASQDRMVEASRLTASTIDAELGSLSATVRAAAQELNETQTIETDYIRRRISALRSSHPAIRTAALVGADGRLIAAEGASDSTRVNYSDRPYFVGAMQDPNAIFVSNPFVSTLAGNLTVITVSTAIKAPAPVGDTAQIRGVLMTAIDVAATFHPLIATFSNTDGVDVSVFDRDAQRIIGSSELATDTTLINQLTAIHNTPNWTNPSRLTTTETGKYVFSLSPVANTGFVVAASATKESVFAPLREFEDRMSYMVLLIGIGTIVGLSLVVRSMRRRDQALDDVRSASERAELVIDTAVQAFAECDSRGLITTWNRAAESMFDYPAEEAIGQDFALLVVSDGCRDEFRAEFVAAMNNPDGSVPDKREWTLVRKGSPVAFNAEATLWTTRLHGNKSRCIFVDDITARLQLEAARELVLHRQRELVEELRIADQAKSDFMSTVSHELRTPLTSIVGYVEMLHEGYGGELDKSAMSMVEVIDRNSQRLLNMIEDLLMLSRIESGYDKPEISLVEMATLVQAVGDALLPQAREHKLTLDIDVEAGLPLVRGDANQLERVLLNLASNAVKFTPDGGRVSIDVKANDDHEIVVRVSDSGIGIPLDEQHKLFNRFFRSSTARSNAIQGTGLGLAIVKGIVDRHNGRISLESEPGVGTTVEIALPAVVTSSTPNV